MRPGNVVFLFFITAGAFLIYSVVSKLVLEQQKIIELQTRNHQLSTQTLDNTFSGSLDIDQEGHFVSSKHEGLGLGTESIKSIAEKYGGVCKFEANNGMFYASVMCFKDHA